MLRAVGGCRIILRPPDAKQHDSAPIAAKAPRMSVSCGPKKFETRNCVPAKAMPQTAAAGSTPLSPLNPPITRIRYAGTNSETGAQMRPTPALKPRAADP